MAIKLSYESGFSERIDTLDNIMDTGSVLRSV
jgi:hypothetical protein